MTESAKVIDHPKKDTAPALGFSYQVELAPGKTIVLQTHVANDASVHDLNTMLDKLAQAGSRQKAREELKQLQKQLKQHQKSLRNQKEDAERLDKDFAKLAAVHKEKLSALAGEKDAATRQAEESHSANRRGNMRDLPPAVRQKIAAVNSVISKATDEWTTQAQKHEADQAGYRTNVARFEEAIIEIESDIAECKRILGE